MFGRICFLTPSAHFLRKDEFVDSKYRIIPKISPAAYMFQWPFLRGLYISHNRIGLYWERNMRLEIHRASLVGRKCMLLSNNLQQVFTETRREDVDLSNLSHASTLSIWTEEIQTKTEDCRYASSNILLHFLTAIIWHT